MFGWVGLIVWISATASATSPAIADADAGTDLEIQRLLPFTRRWSRMEGLEWKEMVPRMEKKRMDVFFDQINAKEVEEDTYAKEPNSAEPADPRMGKAGTFKETDDVIKLMDSQRHFEGKVGQPSRRLNLNPAHLNTNEYQNARDIFYKSPFPMVLRSHHKIINMDDRPIHTPNILYENQNFKDVHGRSNQERISPPFGSTIEGFSKYFLNDMYNPKLEENTVPNFSINNPTSEFSPVIAPFIQSFVKPEIPLTMQILPSDGTQEFAAFLSNPKLIASILPLQNYNFLPIPLTIVSQILTLLRPFSQELSNIISQYSPMIDSLQLLRKNQDQLSYTNPDTENTMSNNNFTNKISKPFSMPTNNVIVRSSIFTPNLNDSLDDNLHNSKESYKDNERPALQSDDIPNTKKSTIIKDTLDLNQVEPKSPFSLNRSVGKFPIELNSYLRNILSRPLVPIIKKNQNGLTMDNNSKFMPLNFIKKSSQNGESQGGIPSSLPLNKQINLEDYFDNPQALNNMIVKIPFASETDRSKAYPVLPIPANSFSHNAYLNNKMIRNQRPENDFSLYPNYLDNIHPKDYIATIPQLNGMPPLPSLFKQQESILSPYDTNLLPRNIISHHHSNYQNIPAARRSGDTFESNNRFLKIYLPSKTRNPSTNIHGLIISSNKAVTLNPNSPRRYSANLENRQQFAHRVDHLLPGYGTPKNMFYSLHGDEMNESNAQKPTTAHLQQNYKDPNVGDNEDENEFHRSYTHHHIKHYNNGLGDITPFPNMKHKSIALPNDLQKTSFTDIRPLITIDRTSFYSEPLTQKLHQLKSNLPQSSKNYYPKTLFILGLAKNDLQDPALLDDDNTNYFSHKKNDKNVYNYAQDDLESYQDSSLMNDKEYYLNTDQFQDLSNSNLPIDSFKQQPDSFASPYSPNINLDENHPTKGLKDPKTLFLTTRYSNIADMYRKSNIFLPASILSKQNILFPQHGSILAKIVKIPLPALARALTSQSEFTEKSVGLPSKNISFKSSLYPKSYSHLGNKLGALPSDSQNSEEYLPEEEGPSSYPLLSDDPEFHFTGKRYNLEHLPQNFQMKQVIPENRVDLLRTALASKNHSSRLNSLNENLFRKPNERSPTPHSSTPALIVDPVVSNIVSSLPDIPTPNNIWHSPLNLQAKRPGIQSSYPIIDPLILKLSPTLLPTDLSTLLPKIPQLYPPRKYQQLLSHRLSHKHLAINHS